MYPYVLKFGSVAITTYGFVLMFAAIVIGIMGYRITRQGLGGLAPLQNHELINGICWVILGGILGARFFHIAVYWERYQFRPDLLFVIDGGFGWYGGFVGAIVTARMVLKIHGHSLVRSLDQLALLIALGYSILRVACFSQGCSYGVVTSSWFGVKFPSLPNPVVPVQLIESGGSFVLYGMLRRLQTPMRLHTPGMLSGWFFVSFGLLRFSVDWWRANLPIGWLGWSVTQWISLVFVGVGLILLMPRQARGHS